VPERPGEPIRVKSRNITAIIRTESDPQPHVVEVAFEVRTLQGEPVVTYQTDGRIHPNASRILLDILKTRKSNYESLRLVKDIYEVVSNGNFVSWRATSAKPQMATETKDVLAEFRPAIPRLEKLLSDPASIDNNLTATWLADRQVIRLTASIQAELGYATVTVDTQSYGDEESQRTLFKLLAEPDKTLRASQVRRILKKSVQAVAVGVHEGGVDSVSERFSDDQRDRYHGSIH
jgi:hypothetical protein